MFKVESGVLDFGLAAVMLAYDGPD